MDWAPTPQTSWRFFSLVISASLWISWYTLTPTRDALGTVCNQMKIISLQYLSCMALIFKLKFRQARQTLEKVARTFTAFAFVYLYFKATLTFFKVPKGMLCQHFHLLSQASTFLKPKVYRPRRWILMSKWSHGNDGIAIWLHCDSFFQACSHFLIYLWESCYNKDLRGATQKAWKLQNG